MAWLIEQEMTLKKFVNLDEADIKFVIFVVIIVAQKAIAEHPGLLIAAAGQ